MIAAATFRFSDFNLRQMMIPLLLKDTQDEQVKLNLNRFLRVWQILL